MAVISFARGVPAPELLPVEELADCARAVIERDGRTVLNYGPVGGYGPLREWVGARYGVEPGRVEATNGSLPGLSLLIELLLELRPGRVLVEGPTYDRALWRLARLGAEVTTIPLDDEGLDVDALERELRAGPISFLYAIPTFQNPSGRTLSAERRRRLAELAREHDLLVIEDDPYGLVRFEGEPPPRLHELAPERVVYSSSFSKIVAPGARVGYFVLPPGLVAPYEARAVQTYLTPVLVGQATVFEFLRRGNLEPNLERVCAALRQRRDAMLAALERELPGGAAWSRPDGGYFLWLDLPEGVQAAQLLARADEAGVTFVKGADFYPGGADGHGSARLAYSFVSAAEIDEGVTRLAALLPRVAAAV